MTARGFYFPSPSLRLTPPRQVAARHGVVTTPARGQLRLQLTANCGDHAVIYPGLASIPGLFPSAATMGVPNSELLSSQRIIALVEDSFKGSVAKSPAE